MRRRRGEARRGDEEARRGEEEQARRGEEEARRGEEEGMDARRAWLSLRTMSFLPSPRQRLTGSTILLRPYVSLTPLSAAAWETNAMEVVPTACHVAAELGGGGEQ